MWARVGGVFLVLVAMLVVVGREPWSGRLWAAIGAGELVVSRAESTCRRGAVDEAARWLDGLRDWTPGAGTGVRRLLVAAEIARGRLQWEQARALLREAVGRADDLGERDLQVEARCALAGLVLDGELAADEARWLVGEAESLAVGSDSPTRARIQLLRGDLSWWVEEAGAVGWSPCLVEKVDSAIAAPCATRRALLALAAGELPAAQRRLAEAAELAGADGPLTVDIERWAAAVYAAGGATRLAHEKLEQAAERARSLGDERRLLQIEIERAELLLQLGDWPAADAELRRLIATSEDVAGGRSRARLRLAAGNAALHVGDVERAEAHYLRIGSDAEVGAALVLRSELMKGHAALVRGAIEEARNAFAGVEALAERRGATAVERVYALLARADLAAAEGDQLAAVELIESVAAVEAALVARPGGLLRRPQWWQALRRIDALAAVASLDPGVRVRLARVLFRLIEIQRQRSGARMGYRGAPPLELEQAQAALPAGAVLVALIPSSTSTLAMVVTDREAQIRRIEARSDAVSARVHLLRNAAIEGREDIARQTARRLHRVLMEPLEPDFRGKSHLVVIPFGALERLPFAALLDDDGRFLVETFELSLSPSATVALRPSGPATGSGTVAFAVTKSPALPELSAAADEAGAVAVAAGQGGLALRDAAATESAVRHHAARARRLHFATHALEDPLEPDRGYLALHPGLGDDGRLTVREVQELAVAAELVTLASCGSASVGSLHGDELAVGDRAGLAEAFLGAGAKAVVGALGPVDDRATAALVLALHRDLEQHGPVGALARAQRAMLEGRVSDPFGAADWRAMRYWAQFVVVGSS